MQVPHERLYTAIDHRCFIASGATDGLLKVFATGNGNLLGHRQWRRRVHHSVDASFSRLPAASLMFHMPSWWAPGVDGTRDGQPPNRVRCLLWSPTNEVVDSWEFGYFWPLTLCSAKTTQREEFILNSAYSDWIVVRNHALLCHTTRSWFQTDLVKPSPSRSTLDRARFAVDYRSAGYRAYV